MSAILDAGGPRALDLTVEHVQALTDGQYFLEHLSLLANAALEPFCRRCGHLGLDPSITLERLEDRHNFRCAHTAGWVKRSDPLDLQPLLSALGWDLRCPRCRTLAQADNSRTDATFLVSCHCSLRTLRNPLAHPHPNAARVRAMVRLGGQQPV